MNDTLKVPIEQAMKSCLRKGNLENAIEKAYGKEFADDGFFVLKSGIP